MIGKKYKFNYVKIKKVWGVRGTPLSSWELEKMQHKDLKVKAQAGLGRELMES